MEEYLNKFIAAGKRYGELPDRFRLSVSEEDWRRRWVSVLFTAEVGGNAESNW